MPARQPPEPGDRAGAWLALQTETGLREPPPAQLLGQPRADPRADVPAPDRRPTRLQHARTARLDGSALGGRPRRARRPARAFRPRPDWRTAPGRLRGAVPRRGPAQRRGGCVAAGDRARGERFRSARTIEQGRAGADATDAGGVPRVWRGRSIFAGAVDRWRGAAPAH